MIMRFSPSLSFSPLLITSLFLFSFKYLISCCLSPRLIPLPLHVYLWCCSLWLSLPTVDESVDWLEVVSGVGSGGLALSRPVSLCHSSLQSGKQDETVPSYLLTTVKDPQTHSLTHSHSLFHYCGARTHREKWDWGGRREQGVKRVRPCERGRKRNRKQAL